MPLSDDALAVRGGSVRDPHRIAELVIESIEDGDGPVLSIWCADYEEGETRQDLLLRICREADFPHKKVQVTTVGALRAVLNDLVQESSQGEPATHFHAVFQEDMSLSQAEAFVSALSEPEPNPTGGKS